jgi:hypothetical protein
MAMGMAAPVEPEVVFAKRAFEYGEAITGTLRLSAETANQKLTVNARLSDSLGRILFDGNVALPKDAMLKEIPFKLEPRGVTAFRHYVKMTVKQSGKEVCTATGKVLTKPPREWDDYVVMMWQRHNKLRWDHFQEEGIRYMQWGPYWEPSEQVDAGIGYYIDNAVTKYYAPYHLWMPDKPKNFYFDRYMAFFTKDRENPANWVRTPSLADPIVLMELERACDITAQRQRDSAPFWYSLADEPGIGDQAAPSDFDWHPESLRDFREWLKAEYKDLDTLNAEWGTKYAYWEKVLPMTNTEGVKAGYTNPAAWVDFKDYMDTQMCRVYKLGYDAIRKYDPGAYVGIGGVQGPEAVGCWDFYKMAQAMDTFEAYYIGNNAELMRSLQAMGQRLRMIYSYFGATDKDQHYEWYLFMHGTNASLIWDDDSSWVDDTGKRSARAQKMDPMHLEQVNGLGRQLLHAHRADDPVAIYFSMASLRAHWVRELSDSGQDWAQRRSWTERTQSLAMKRRLSWVFLVEDAGLQYKFVFDDQVRKDGAIKDLDKLDGGNFKVLIMPVVIALSPEEEKAIKDFVAAGGTVIADGQFDLTDKHGKPVEKPALAELFGVQATQKAESVEKEVKAADGWAERLAGGKIKLFEAALTVTAQDAKPFINSGDGAAAIERKHEGGGKTMFLNLDVIDYYKDRGQPGKDEPMKSVFAALFAQELGAKKCAPVVTATTNGLPQNVETFLWETGNIRFVGVLRNPLQRAKELGGIEYEKAGPLDVNTDLVLASIPGIDSAKVDVYDVRAGKKLDGGLPQKFTLAPYEPRIFAVVPKGFAPTAPQLPKAVNTTTLAEKPCKVTFDKSVSGGEEVYHVFVKDPSGKDVWRYGANVSVEGDKGVEFTVPFALNDVPGDWTIDVRHIPTGTVWSGKVSLKAGK